MKVSKTMDGKKLTIAVEGRLDTNTSPELQSEIAQLGDVDELVFDFAKLIYISSAGLRVLMVAHKSMGGIKIINVNDDVMEIFEITGFNSIFNIETA